MRVFKGFDSLPKFTRPTVTVGSYDGVHSGHMALLNTVMERAKADCGESIVITFEPHPRITLGKDDGLRLLTTTKEKILLLEKLGIDNIIIIPFDKAFSDTSPANFVVDYLIEKVGAERLVVGFNHHFGHNKEGDNNYLEHIRTRLKIECIQECSIDGKVSSTVIRGLIEGGNMVQATKLLSHPYIISCRASSDALIISEPLKLIPKQGIYSVDINGQNAELKIGANNNLSTNISIADGEIMITFLK